MTTAKREEMLIAALNRQAEALEQIGMLLRTRLGNAAYPGGTLGNDSTVPWAIPVVVDSSLEEGRVEIRREGETLVAAVVPPQLLPSGSLLTEPTAEQQVERERIRREAIQHAAEQETEWKRMDAEGIVPAVRSSN